MKNKFEMTEELNNIREFLVENKYKVWETEQNEYPNCFILTQKLQRRLDMEDGFDFPLCQCDDKLFLNIEPTQAHVNGNVSDSSEMSLVHEYNGEWCGLKIYSISSDDLQNKLGFYEQKILNMWKVFCE